MNDKLQSALRDLETHAPDVTDTRAAVYRGIDTRARRKRLATTVGAVACAAGVIMPATLLLDGDASKGTVAAPSRAPARVVPIQAPDTTQIPVTVPRVFTDETRSWDWFADGTLLLNLWSPSTEETAKVMVSRQKPDDEGGTSGPPKSDEPITVNGRDARLLTYSSEFWDTRAHIQWRQDGRWVRVMAADTERATTAAEALRDKPTQVKVPLRLLLAPQGFKSGDYSWSDETALATACEGGDPWTSRCYHASDLTSAELPAKLKDGPEPKNGRCSRMAWPPTFGKARTVDGKQVRLSSDGCQAVVEDKRIALRAYEGSNLRLTDFARMAASIEIRG